MTGGRFSWTDDAERRVLPARPRPIPVLIASRETTPKGNVLLVHGRNGAPDQPQIVEIAEAYLAMGWRVVAPELPNSSALPDSGPASELTLTGHLAAAAEAWQWVLSEWPSQSCALAGHSIGAFVIAHLAAGTPATQHVLAVSPALSGLALLEARRTMGPPAVAELEREAPLFRAEMETQDAAPALARTDARLAVVTGAEDGIVPLPYARTYFTAAGNGRFFAALPGEHHCPAGPACADMLTAALAALGA